MLWIQRETTPTMWGGVDLAGDNQTGIGKGTNGDVVDNGARGEDQGETSSAMDTEGNHGNDAGGGPLLMITRPAVEKKRTKMWWTAVRGVKTREKLVVQWIQRVEILRR